MWLLWTLIAVVGAGVLTGILVTAATRSDGLRDQTMAESGTTETFLPLPEGPLVDEDVADLRFDQALRGYRMSQVDGVIDRLRDELAARDAEIHRLRGALSAPSPVTPLSPDTPFTAPAPAAPPTAAPDADL